MVGYDIDDSLYCQATHIKYFSVFSLYSFDFLLGIIGGRNLKY